jgi:sugar lactone lactonase YvrE
MTLRAELALDAAAEIGEGPIWDVDARELLWVDIPPGLLHRFKPEAGRDRSLDVGQPLGAVALRADGGLVLAVRDGFAVLVEDGNLRMLAEVETEKTGTRMNDGACDARGRFWAGTMDSKRTRGAASLYRLEPPASVRRVLEGVTISNGIDWSPDGETMFYVDSPSGCVDAFEFNADAGTIGRRRHLVEFPSDSGMPDGLTVDAEGFLWVALYGGGAVRRYSPEGRLDAVVELPVSLVTSCAFGDDDLGTLYITSASRGLDAAAREREPGAGGLFRVRPGVSGRLPHRFG